MIDLIVLAAMIYLTSRMSLVNDNLTTVLQIHEYRLITIIFMILTTIYLAYSFIRLFHQSVDGRRYDWLVIVSGLIMIVSIICPYYENRHDLWSQIHVYGSLYGCMICLFFGLLLVKSYFLSGHSIERVMFLIVLMTMIIIAVTIQCGGISGLSEILTLLTMLLVLRIVST